MFKTNLLKRFFCFFLCFILCFNLCTRPRNVKAVALVDDAAFWLVILAIGGVVCTNNVLEGWFDQEDADELESLIDGNLALKLSPNPKLPEDDPNDDEKDEYDREKDVNGKFTIWTTLSGFKNYVASHNGAAISGGLLLAIISGVESWYGKLLEIDNQSSGNPLNLENMPYNAWNVFTGYGYCNTPDGYNINAVAATDMNAYNESLQSIYSGGGTYYFAEKFTDSISNTTKYAWIFPKTYATVSDEITLVFENKEGGYIRAYNADIASVVGGLVQPIALSTSSTQGAYATLYKSVTASEGTLTSFNTTAFVQHLLDWTDANSFENRDIFLNPDANILVVDANGNYINLANKQVYRTASNYGDKDKAKNMAYAYDPSSNDAIKNIQNNGAADIAQDTGTSPEDEAALQDDVNGLQDAITDKATDDAVNDNPDVADDVGNAKDPAPDPNPDPGTDPSPGTDTTESPSTGQDPTTDDVELSWSSFDVDLTNIFPFCIPFDVYHLVAKLNVAPEPLIVNVPINVGNRSYGRIYIDFSEYENYIIVFRTFLDILFVAFIISLMRRTKGADD